MTPPFAHWSPSPQFSWGMATFGAFCGPGTTTPCTRWPADCNFPPRQQTRGWYMGNEKCQHSCVDRQNNRCFSIDSREESQYPI